MAVVDDDALRHAAVKLKVGRVVDDASMMMIMIIALLFRVCISDHLLY